MTPAAFASTRRVAPEVSFSTALRDGLAPDGGLYVPIRWPRFDSAALFAMPPELAPLAADLAHPFVAGDVLAGELASICSDAFDFPAPLTEVDPTSRLHVLELFHGPTAAFKDFGARFLAACLQRLQAPHAPALNVLVATSGDTGGAVAAAFHRRPGLAVTVLFPKGLVSPTQQQQLTCWGDNVRALAVRGTFDDCQRLVKAALAGGCGSGPRLSSANSINLGRLLPQMAYYGAASLAFHRRHGEALSFVIPSGNLGNGVACIWARHLGFPIDRIVLAHNANRTVPEFLGGSAWRPRPSVSTLASAMDVGDPSNMERLRDLLPDERALRAAVAADSVDDDAIRARLRADFERWGRIWCPHTAVAAEAWARLPAAQRASPWAIVATAHPAKFPEIVEPLIGQSVDTPPALATLFSRPSRYDEIDARLEALQPALTELAA